MKGVSTGLQKLKEEVLDKGLCTLCGSCLGMCPYLKFFQGKVIIMDHCTLTVSRCYDFCPMVGVEKELLSAPYSGKPLGEIRDVMMTRSTDPEILKKAQYGGTVSTLIYMALKKGLIDKALLTKHINGVPKGVIVSSREEVLACSGSNFLISPSIEAFNRWQPVDAESIGVVGTPCQLRALAKMRLSPLAELSNISRVALIIGLFCTWGLSHSFYYKVLINLVPHLGIKRMDAPPPPANILEVYTSEGCITIPLDRVRPFIQSACALCFDMTAEMSDLSLGAVEGIKGWNTLLIRTERGQNLLEMALAEGLIEKCPLPEANFSHLKEAAQLKKERALRAFKERRGF